ncbi:MoaD/ThiS family protein [Rhizobium sp. BK251]|uniref:MoaD/ThiS family protein n=1 Tax=Rhizobium sp. BK251 TaxID=2512125 RepID=UPI00105222F0|nr:MoaD/ThiS family protein [Rhizobium sp. BK251]TCL76245.1 molybdopterin synthase subunit MoaD [Rhizobium sp. BK251]
MELQEKHHHLVAPVQVRLPGVLVDLFPGSVRRLDLHVATVNEMIDALDERWPGMADRIRDSRPSVRKHINIFVDGERATLKTSLPPGAEVFVLTAISGG